MVIMLELQYAVLSTVVVRKGREEGRCIGKNPDSLVFMAERMFLTQVSQRFGVFDVVASRTEDKSREQKNV